MWATLRIRRRVFHMSYTNKLVGRISPCLSLTSKRAHAYAIEFDLLLIIENLYHCYMSPTWFHTATTASIVCRFDIFRRIAHCWFVSLTGIYIVRITSHSHLTQ